MGVNAGCALKSDQRIISDKELRDRNTKWLSVRSRLAGILIRPCQEDVQRRSQLRL